jgi:excisionase family DNA binding protein
MTSRVGPQRPPVRAIDQQSVVSYLQGINRTLPERDETSMADQTPDALLTPAEVAALFRVNPKTVTRWARAGKITAIRTLGGHRRFRASEIQRCLERMEHDQA